MFDNFKADLKKYSRSSRLFDKSNLYLLFEQGIWAVAVYRFGRMIRRVKIPVISHFLKLIAFFMFKSIEMSTGISIPNSAQIGKGFYVGHFSCIILHSNVIMGENCSIGPGVLIGARGLGSKGTPVIGNNVYIGAGAKVLGGIKIGNNVKIGANAVVVKDAPDGATVVGIPGRIVRTD